jgi:hypothetical protein
MSETCKIAVILVADVVGYSRLASADEDRTLSRLRGLRSDLIDPAIAAHHGRIVKRTGDGSLIEFRSVDDAVRCAIGVQSARPAYRPNDASSSASASMRSSKPVVIVERKAFSVAPAEISGSHQILARRSHSLFRHSGVGARPPIQHV